MLSSLPAGRIFFRFGKAAHGFFNQRQENVRSVANQELGLGMPFVQ